VDGNPFARARQRLQQCPSRTVPHAGGGGRGSHSCRHDFRTGGPRNLQPHEVPPARHAGQPIHAVHHLRAHDVGPGHAPHPRPQRRPPPPSTRPLLLLLLLLPAPPNPTVSSRL
ncbi:unnamed protein product, partial [Laminaria digitata]